jgi:hypothetical protein
MTDRVFISYESAGTETLDEVARLLSGIGLGVSGRNYTRDELFVVGSPLQQLQAAVVTLVLVTENATNSELVAQEIDWAIEQHKGVVGLRLDRDAEVPPRLFDAGAEILDASDSGDIAYLSKAIDAAIRGARLLEMAATRGSGSGAVCQRPTGPG